MRVSRRIPNAACPRMHARISPHSLRLLRLNLRSTRFASIIDRRAALASPRPISQAIRSSTDSTSMSNSRAWSPAPRPSFYWSLPRNSPPDVQASSKVSTSPRLGWGAGLFQLRWQYIYRGLGLRLRTSHRPHWKLASENVSKHRVDDV